MPKQLIFGLITFLHDLFTAVWIGGMLALVAAVLPSVRQTLGKGTEMQKLLDAIQSRLSKLIYISIVGLAITGLLLSNRSQAWQGFFTWGNTYSVLLSIKHLLFLAMIVIALVRSLGLRAATPQQAAQVQKHKLALLLINTALGVIVLLLSGLSAAFATTPLA